MIFLKLGGSLITDKTQGNTPRLDVIAQLVGEIHSTLLVTRHLPLLLGHGSGSFGHAAAKKHGTRGGVHGEVGWRGFAEVSVAAQRLNRIVADALHDTGVPVFSVCPSASAQCKDGKLIHLDVAPIMTALAHGLVPLVMGDVAFDSVLGGTIVSTEEVFAYLANHLPVTHVLLAGETEGVYQQFSTQLSTDAHKEEAFSASLHLGVPIIPRITPHTWAAVQGGVGASRGADVTGGMAGKVRDMLALVQMHPTLTVRIFNGLVKGNLQRALAGERFGTEVAATDDAQLGSNAEGKPGERNQATFR